MKKRGKATKKSSGGFHAAWLVLVELVASGLVVTMGLRYNFVVAVVAVCVPVYVALKKVARQHVAHQSVAQTKEPVTALQSTQPYAHTPQHTRPSFGRPTNSLATS